MNGCSLKRTILLTGVLIMLALGCGKEKPTMFDGVARINVLVIDTTGTFLVNSLLGYAPIPHTKVVIQSSEYDFIQSIETDQYGLALFKNLYASRYKIIVSKNVNAGAYEFNLAGTKEVEVFQEQDRIDTLICHVSKLSGLTINEIYYCGPVNNSFYCYDQFIELYNRSQMTLYLDGIIVGRMNHEFNPDLETNDFVEAIYCFQFPGQPLGSQYPIQPGQFVVIAQDAFDHSSVIRNAADLSQADWEFYDGYGGDWDNFAVPNVNNILPNRQLDFLIDVKRCGVIISDGSEYVVTDKSVRFPLRTILDGVEYAESTSYIKKLTTRVDAGFAGVGLQKYSGKSIQRIEPGYDSNNSTIDFMILAKPTPGRQ